MSGILANKLFFYFQNCLKTVCLRYTVWVGLWLTESTEEYQGTLEGENAIARVIHCLKDSDNDVQAAALKASRAFANQGI